MTQTPGSVAARHHVVVIGAGVSGLCTGAELLKAGVSDFVILEKADRVSRACPPALEGHLRFGREVIGSVFDDDADTWTLKTDGEEIWQSRAVIAAYGPLLVPWIPDLAGRNNFRGVSFHAAEWDRDFDPVGRRIAVIGADATAGHYIGPLTKAAASVTVFAYPPRRVIAELPLRATRANRWLRRHATPLRPAVAAKSQRPKPELMNSTIDTVTESGIRTSDRGDHDVDTIIYGTGFTIHADTLVGAGGLATRQVWQDGMEPYHGVVVRGFPNYFLLTGPDVETQARYIVECLGLLTRTGSTRIEVRRSSQQVFNERVHLRPPRRHPMPSAFDLSSAADADEIYDGPATMTIADTGHKVRVRLTGYLDPIDGKFHWRGMVFDSLPDDVLKQTHAVTVTVGKRSASARITERTPWGSYSLVGVGVPPFAVDGAVSVDGPTRR